MVRGVDVVVGVVKYLQTDTNTDTDTNANTDACTATEYKFCSILSINAIISEFIEFLFIPRSIKVKAFTI